MVYPISGPFGQHINRGTFKLHRTWYRQAKPYTVPLTFSFVTQKTIYDSVNRDIASGWVPTLSMFTQDYNRLYNRFTGKVKGDTADIGTLLAEYGEARSMIASRAADLWVAAKFVKRLQIVDAARVLLKGHTSASVKGRNVERGLERARRIQAKDPASAWLELSFGWIPTVEDILNAASVLASPPRTGYVSASVKAHRRIDLYGAPGGRYQYSDVDVILKCGASVQITNPNVALANQLGLLNPAVIAWEVIPFSFVVDRFVNIKHVLSSFTDYAGLSLSQKYVTQDYDWKEWYFGRVEGELRHIWTYGGHRTLRDTSIFPGPVLALKPARGMRPTEGLNYIALLAQQLKSF